MELNEIICWNGYYYGIKQAKKSRYYKSKTVRFDETFGGTVEITQEEYDSIAKKYFEVFLEVMAKRI